MSTGVIETLRSHVIQGRIADSAEIVEEALGQGLSATDILEQGLLPALDEVGQRFERDEIYVPEMMVSAKAVQGGLDILRPLLAESGVEPIGKIALGTVQGDLHDIGKNLVGLMLEGAGFEVTDLGINVPPERFVEAVQDGAGLVGLSALLTTTMANMPAVLQALESADLRARVRMMIGGAPLTQSFAEEIGADGYAPDASRAVTLARALLGVTG